MWLQFVVWFWNKRKWFTINGGYLKGGFSIRSNNTRRGSHCESINGIKTEKGENLYCNEH